MRLAPARFYLGRWGLYWHRPGHFGLTIGWLPERFEWGIHAAWDFNPNADEGEWHYRRRFCWSLPRITLCRRWYGKRSRIIGIVVGGRRWIWGR